MAASSAGRALGLIRECRPVFAVQPDWVRTFESSVDPLEPPHFGSDQPVVTISCVGRMPEGTVASAGSQMAHQRELLEFGTDADVHARPMHISSEDPSPQVTKWDGAFRRMGNS